MSDHHSSISLITSTGARAMSCADLQRESVWFEVLHGHEDYARTLAAQGLHPKDPHTLAELTEDLLTTLGISDPTARATILALPLQCSSLIGSGCEIPESASRSDEIRNDLKSNPGEEDEAPTFGKFRRRYFSKRNGRTPAQEVVPGIFLGGTAAAEDRSEQQSLGITHVLNATAHQPRTPLQNTKMLMLHLRDGDGEQDLTKHFPACIDFIDEARKDGGAVLVHCVRGVSRSSALVIAYLIARAGMTFEDALALTKRARPIAKPRRGFCQQLQAYRTKVQYCAVEVKREVTPVLKSRRWHRSQFGKGDKKIDEP